jgi:hypothetical protein
LLQYYHFSPKLSFPAHFTHSEAEQLIVRSEAVSLKWV